MDKNQRRTNGVDICTECGSENIKCTDSRSRPYGRNRGKKCLDCRHSFHTIETPAIKGTSKHVSVLRQLRRDIDSMISKALDVMAEGSMLD